MFGQEALAMLSSQDILTNNGAFDRYINNVPQQQGSNSGV